MLRPGTPPNIARALAELAEDLWQPKRPEYSVEQAQDDLNSALAAQEAAAGWTTEQWVEAHNQHHANRVKQAKEARELVAELGEMSVVCMNVRSHFSPAIATYEELNQLASYITAQIRAMTQSAATPEMSTLDEFKRLHMQQLAAEVTQQQEYLLQTQKLWRKYEATRATLDRVRTAITPPQS